MWAQGFSPLSARVKYHYLCLDRGKCKMPLNPLHSYGFYKRQRDRRCPIYCPGAGLNPKKHFQFLHTDRRSKEQIVNG